MAEFELDNAGNSEAQQKQATAYLFPNVARGVAVTGIISGLAVNQSGTADVNVSVTNGAGVVQGSLTPGASLLVNDTTKVLNVLTANPVGGLPRNDIVVFDSVTASLAVIVGTPNASPSDPTVPTTALPLARLRHAASAVTIPTSKIDALRKYTALAGTPIPVANAAERDALTPVAGMVVDRLDLGRTERHSGSAWQPIGGKLPHRSLIRSSAPGVATSTEVPLTSGWLAEPDDGGDACGITYSAGILTVAVAGVYAINATLNFNGLGTVGQRTILVRKNGVTALTTRLGGHVAVEEPNINRRIKLAAGDTVQLVAYQSSGGAGSVEIADTYWQLSYVCPA